MCLFSNTIHKEVHRNGVDSNHALVLQTLQLLHQLRGHQRLGVDLQAANIPGEFGQHDAAIALDSLQMDDRRVSEVALHHLRNVLVVEEHVLLHGQRSLLDEREMAMERLVAAEIAERLGASAILAREERKDQMAIHGVGGVDEELQRNFALGVCVLSEPIAYPDSAPTRGISQ